MDAILILVGSVLIALAFMDVLMTVLYYDEAGLLSIRLYRTTWRLMTWATRPLPEAPRSFLLSLGVPFMVFGSLVMWIGLVMFGFAFLYFVGMLEGAFDMREGLEADFWRALYLSGVSMSTLGYGDVTPTSHVFQVLTFLQALMGFAILTLAISYVVNVYQVVRQVGSTGADLYHQAADRFDVAAILRSHFRHGEPHQLGARLMTLHHGLVGLYEGLRHYPLVYYFHSSRGYASVAYLVRAVGELSGALHWGLPRAHEARREPWLQALMASYRSVTQDVERRFLPPDARSPAPPPTPVPLEEFAEAWRQDVTPDRWVRAFLDLDRLTREAAEVLERDDAPDAYARYVGWLPFASEARAVAASTADHLGYGATRFDLNEPLPVRR